MHTGLEKVIKPKQIVITIDLTEDVYNNIGQVVRNVGDRLDTQPLVNGVVGNIGHEGQTVGIWIAK